MIVGMSHERNVPRWAVRTPSWIENLGRFGSRLEQRDAKLSYCCATGAQT